MKKLILVFMTAAILVSCNKADSDKKIQPSNNNGVNEQSKEQVVTIESDGTTYTAVSNETSPGQINFNHYYSTDEGSTLIINVASEDVYPFVTNIYGVKPSKGETGMYKKQAGKQDLYQENFSGVKKGWVVDSFDININSVEPFEYNNGYLTQYLQRMKGDFTMWVHDADKPSERKAVKGTLNCIDTQ